MTNSTVKVSKMNLARAIVTAAYTNMDNTNPRNAAIVQMMEKPSKGGLGMKKTTASTYHGHCIAYFRKIQEVKALEKASNGKPVWSAYKTDNNGLVTSAGLFVTKKAATEFNTNFRHAGVVKGIQKVGKKVIKPSKAA